MRRIVLLAGFCFAATGAYAQSSGPALSINANSNVHAISPDVLRHQFLLDASRNVGPHIPRRALCRGDHTGDRAPLGRRQH
jgi:hypothetical protein